MPTLNVERNKRIQNLWILGQTIDQISLSTGIPRSTVGYYVKKFNKSGRRLQPPPSVTQTGFEASPSESAALKTFFLQEVARLIIDRDYQKLHYFLVSYKTMIQMQSYLKFTEEERKVLQNALSGQSKGSAHVDSVTKKEKTFIEAIEQL
jgi:hypothetical protein